MKIRSVTYNNRKKLFAIKAKGKEWFLPYAKADAQPTAHDPIVNIYVDRELAREGFTYTLKSGREDSLLADQFLDYNKDPGYLRELLRYNLTLKPRYDDKPLSSADLQAIRRGLDDIHHGRVSTLDAYRRKRKV